MPGDVISMSDSADDHPGHTGVVISVNQKAGTGNFTIQYMDENGSLKGGHNIGHDSITVTSWQWGRAFSNESYDSYNWTVQAGSPTPAKYYRPATIFNNGEQEIYYSGHNGELYETYNVNGGPFLTQDLGTKIRRDSGHHSQRWPAGNLLPPSQRRTLRDLQRERRYIPHTGSG